MRLSYHCSILDTDNSFSFFRQRQPPNATLFPYTTLFRSVDTSEEYGEHFASRGWASEQDQIDAGYPIYAQPALPGGEVVLEYDCGVVVPGSKATAGPIYSVGAGSPTVSTHTEAPERASGPGTGLQGEQGQAH